MDKVIPLDLTRMEKLAADIREFPAKIDSVEIAKTVRRVLKKYALLAEKIERNVVIRDVYHKDFDHIRTDEFKTIRRALKEKANAMLAAKNNKTVKSEKAAKKPVKDAAKKLLKKLLKSPLKKLPKKR